MSKSYGNTIPIFASGKELKKIVARIVTDPTPLGSPLPVDTCNVLGLLRLFSEPAEIAAIEGWYRTGQRDGAPFGYGHAKQILTERMEQRFAPARARREALLADRGTVEAILARGAAQARALARATLDDCRRVAGIA
jgi:tryptophanyl-tRNA synthetase